MTMLAHLEKLGLPEPQQREGESFPAFCRRYQEWKEAVEIVVAQAEAEAKWFISTGGRLQ
jgi:hypothetical protein